MYFNRGFYITKSNNQVTAKITSSAARSRCCTAAASALQLTPVSASASQERAHMQDISSTKGTPVTAARLARVSTYKYMQLMSGS